MRIQANTLTACSLLAFYSSSLAMGMTFGQIAAIQPTDAPTIGRDYVVLAFPTK